jgi:hypothetical protein
MENDARIGSSAAFIAKTAPDRVCLGPIINIVEFEAVIHYAAACFTSNSGVTSPPKLFKAALRTYGTKQPACPTHEWHARRALSNDH